MSNELGAGHPKSAAFSVVVVNVLSFIVSVIAAIVVLALRDVISYAFTEGETVAKAVSDLCPLLALTLLLNGIQPVLSGTEKIIYRHINYICVAKSILKIMCVMKVWLLDADGKLLLPMSMWVAIMWLESHWVQPSDFTLIWVLRWLIIYLLSEIFKYVRTTTTN